MHDLDTGKDKLKKICEILKEETLDPAKLEAKKIIEEAEKKAAAIIGDGERKREEILKKAKEEREKEKELFETALSVSSRQVVAGLKQEIEDQFFNKGLLNWLEKETATPNLAADLIKALVKAIEKEGISTDFSAFIPESVSADKVNALLGAEILKKLKEKKVVIGEFMGGVQMKLHDRKVTLDLSEEALKDLIAKYVRKEFRSLVFGG